MAVCSREGCGRRELLELNLFSLVVYLGGAADGDASRDCGW